MVAPSVASVGASVIGAGATLTPGVPSGVVAGSLVLILFGINVDNEASNDAPGFTDLFETGSASLPNINEYYKTASGADAGTYTVNANSGVQNATAQAARIIDAHPTAPFFGTTSLPAPVNNINTAAASIAAVPADSLLLWYCHCVNARTCTVPAGFTRQSVDDNRLNHWATKVHNPGGSGVSDTGSVSGSLSSANQHRVAMIAILPALSGNLDNAFLNLI